MTVLELRPKPVPARLVRRTVVGLHALAKLIRTVSAQCPPVPLGQSG